MTMSEIETFDMVLHVLEVALALGVFAITALVAAKVRRQAEKKSDAARERR
jgi:hypothetical protein